MFILIYGKDAFRARQKLKEIVKKHQKGVQMDLFLNILSSDNLNFQDFKNELRQASMFEGQEIIILRNVFSNTEFRTEFLKEFDLLKKYEDNKKIFIFLEEKSDFLTGDLLKFFKNQAKVYKFDPLKPAALKDWAKKEIFDFGTKIESSALTLLVNSTGGDLWRMSAEIKKLIAYTEADKIINKKDVELLVKPEIESAIFKTIDAIAAKNKKAALDLLYKHLEKGDSPFYILTMINFQFRNLLLVKDLEPMSLPEITAELKPMHPFVVKKSLWLAEKFTMKELEKIYIKLFQIDLAVKTGKIKPEMALELFIADI
ncbi:MAG: DNA polymerase III subunit delta [Patescibacteria group bacterium]|nr:DNA polymerase III subunit delta [Patescibacteria group bacterium]